VSELRSAIEPFRGEVLQELPDARIEDDFAELQRAAELIDVERFRRLAEIERRNLVARDGHLSAAAWLVDRFRLAWGAARDAVLMSRALEAMPHARAALDAGDMSVSAARVLAAAREVDPAAFEDAEPVLVEAARIHSITELQRVAGHWRQGIERERMLALDGTPARRALYASVTLMGNVRVDGDLDPESGESLLTALRAVLDAEARARGRDEDERTPAQRRADALGEICREWLDRSDRPNVGGERPHLTVTVPIETLASRAEVPSGAARAAGAARIAGAPGTADAAGTSDPQAAQLGGAEFDHTGPVAAATVRQLACDAAVMRVVMDGRSQPLDVGRRTPVIPPPMRRAVIARDRTCRFPGCERPHTWCDAHHVVHWADGGPTSAANLLLLCRRHHRMVHRSGGFGVELVDGMPVFRRPDGSVLSDRAPPP
jgi:Domain of unknown function (DUF222)/HNH endonuclease